MIKVFYFAQLRERLACAVEELPPMCLTDVNKLVAMLRIRGGVWDEVFAQDQTIMVAVNQELAGFETEIKDGDEIAFFPPVTGG